MNDSSPIRAYSSRAEKERDRIQRGVIDLESGRQSRLESMSMLVLEVWICTFVRFAVREIGYTFDEGIRYLLEPGCRA